MLHTVANLMFSQSAYSQPENISQLLVTLMLDATSGTTTQEIVAQITAGAQEVDTARGKHIS